ncbi:hypothetical protein B7463_g6606, partial [Scytalidium lignicola]
MVTRIVLITGANSGVGYATTKVIANASKDFHVIMTGRSLEKVERAKSEIETAGIQGSLSAVQLDVTDEKSIEQAVEVVQEKHGRLDALINNAGVGSMDPDIRARFTLCMETNVLGPALVATAFRPLLFKSQNPYSIFVSSGVGSLTKALQDSSTYHPLPNEDAYRSSKAALNMVAAIEWRDFHSKGLKVFTMCPGFVVSNLRGTSEEARTGGGGAGDPEVSGMTILSILQGERDADTGKLPNLFSLTHVELEGLSKENYHNCSYNAHDIVLEKNTRNYLELSVILNNNALALADYLQSKALDPDSRDSRVFYPNRAQCEMAATVLSLILTIAVATMTGLDELPNELKVSILLYMHNMPTLQALVQSSPSYHETYISQRRLILSAVLLRDIPSEVLPDAIAVQYASEIPFQTKAQRKKDVESAVLRYVSQRSSFIPATLVSVEMNTLISLAQLQSIIVDITSDFCNFRLPLCLLNKDPAVTNNIISPNEKHRIYRALYRFELYRALFNEPIGVGIPDEAKEAFDDVDKTILFLSIFKIWEVEELACVQDYITRRDTELLKCCAPELTKLRPGKNFYDDSWQARNVEYFLTVGLSFLRRVIRTYSALGKAYALKDHIYSGYGLLSSALEVETYDYMYPTDSYYAYEAGESLEFESDNAIDGPNAAWPWSTEYRIEGYKVRSEIGFY